MKSKMSVFANVWTLQSLQTYGVHTAVAYCAFIYNYLNRPDHLLKTVNSI